MQLTKTIKPKNENINFNFEIQSTDYKHGLSTCTSTINILKTETIENDESDENHKFKNDESNNISNANNTSQLQAPPQSLLTLKVNTPISDLDLLNVQSNSEMKNLNSNSSSLFPIAFKESNKIVNKFNANPTCKIIPIENILHLPGRNHRPHKIVICLRGPPGSGKSLFANLIKQEEEKFVSSSEKPKIFSIDNYFISDQDEETTGHSNSKKQILMKYEYDETMDEVYQRSLVKSFKKTIDDSLFNFIIVDMINNKINNIDEMSQYAKTKGGFQTFIIELNDQDEAVYFSRNVHNRSIKDIRNILKEWDLLPNCYTKLDVSFFLQNHEIEQVDMEDNKEQDSSKNKNIEAIQVPLKSKWEEKNQDSFKKIKKESDTDGLKE